MDVTTLKVLAKMASGEEGPNARFQFMSPDTKGIICSCSTIEELYDCIVDLEPEVLQIHVCSCEDFDQSTGTRDLAFYIHYVFGDAELSMKIYSAAERYAEDSDKLKLEIGNLLFTRLLNYSEIALIPD
ncbi:MAG: hypothetical protein GOP50_06550 [Candidatus Heimdallarchaeota archaeon]|nr:hypothetical protein [Candidatus Heimdallarchaeota archaeon]